MEFTWQIILRSRDVWVFMGVKGYFHVVPDSETGRPRNQSSMYSVNRNKCSFDLQVSHLLKIEQSSPATGPGYGAEIVPKVEFLVWKEALSGTVSATLFSLSRGTVWTQPNWSGTSQQVWIES